MNKRPPTPDYTVDPEWRWPWAKFSLPPDALFKSLHDRFNTTRFNIQEPRAFLSDVREASDRSCDVKELHTFLAKRRDQRITELEAAWSDVSSLIVATPDSIDCACSKHEASNHWQSFLGLANTMSFDSLVGFFDRYIRDERKHQLEESKKRYRDCRGEILGKNTATEVTEFQILQLYSPSPKSTRKQLKAAEFAMYQNQALSRMFSKFLYGTSHFTLLKTTEHCNFSEAIYNNPESGTLSSSSLHKFALNLNHRKSNKRFYEEEDSNNTFEKKRRRLLQ